MRTNLSMHKLAEGIGAVLFLMKFEPNSPHLARDPDLCKHGRHPADGCPVCCIDGAGMSEHEARTLAHFDREAEHVERVAKDPEFIAAHYGAGMEAPRGPDVADAWNTAAARALRSGDFDADAAPMTAEAAVRYQRTRGCPHCFTVQARTNRVCAGCAKALPRLRDRVRSPKLYACDIEAGASYVPKRGNDKTPNYYVVATEAGADGMPARVWWRRATPQGGGVAPSVSTAGEFLALVARRADA